MGEALDCALNFAKTEKHGGGAPIIGHQMVGYALADAKMAIEAVRSLSLRAAHAFDKQLPGALELALHAKVHGSETAVRDLGPYAHCWDRQLRSHGAAWRPAR
jgi:nitroalkane oxidase